MVGIMTFNRKNLKNSGKIDFGGPRKEIRVGEIAKGTSLQRSSDSKLMDPRVRAAAATNRNAKGLSGQDFIDAGGVGAALANAGALGLHGQAFLDAGGAGGAALNAAA